MTDRTRLGISLLGLRLTVFLVMAVWTVDKFVNPGHAAGVFENFYGLGEFGTWAIWLVAALEVLLLLAFVVGLARTWTYGAVVVLHGVSTLAAFTVYLTPFTGAHLLFFAAWPMWAAAIALFLLRHHDIYTVQGGARRS